MHFPYVIIGAGAGGLVSSIGLAKAGKKVLLIERGTFGGDCTNFGCIPSKALIASAEIADKIQKAEEYGIEPKSKEFQTKKVLSRIREIIAAIRSHEDAPALEKQGVQVLTATARFKDPHTIEAKKENGEVVEVTADTIVLAVGSSPTIPNIEGFDKVSYLTNETVFDLKKPPESMIVLGGGPIGSELAQAFQRLGTKVSLVHKYGHLLAKESDFASEIIAQQFQKEGMKIYFNAEAKKICEKQNQVHLLIDQEGKKREITAEKILISIGRHSNAKYLDLEKAGIALTEKGIAIDSKGRCSEKHIYAVGDVAGPPFFTHFAENHSRSVLKSLLLPWKSSLSSQPIPRVTYTDPEVATIGLLENEAKDLYGEKKIVTYHVPFSEVDRAITQGRTEGAMQIVTKKWSSKILGATIVGPRAGEMLSEIALAMMAKIPLRKLAKLMHAYPTYNLGIRKAADLWLAQTILPEIKKWFKK